MDGRPQRYDCDVHFCEAHIYSGFFPCPWPECANGTRAEDLELRGKRVFSQRFGDIVGQPVYAWIIDGVSAADRASQLTRRAIAQVNGAPSVADDGFLYHFTTEPALRSILTTDELWLTDYRDFSDKQEIQEGQTVADATFRHLEPELSVETKRILATLVNAPLSEGVYVACFSMLKDSPHHWTEYAKDASGGALVMNPLSFGPLLARDPFAIQFTRVAYAWDVKAGLFASLAVWLEELVYFDKKRGLFDENVYADEMTQIFSELLPMCKDVSFLREHEVRLVVTPAQAKSDLAANLYVRSIPGRRYITTRGVLPGFSLPIEKVVLGPSFAGDRTTLNVAPVKLEQM